MTLFTRDAWVDTTGDRPMTRLQRQVLDLVGLYGPATGAQLLPEFQKRRWWNNSAGALYAGLYMLEETGRVTMERVVVDGVQGAASVRYVYTVVEPWK